MGTICCEKINRFFGYLPTLATPCKHEFHEACFAEWLSQGKNRCPNCNGYVDGRIFKKFQRVSFYPYSWFLFQSVSFSMFLNRLISMPQMAFLTAWQLLSLLLYLLFRIYFSKALRQNQSVPQIERKRTETATSVLALMSVVLQVEGVVRLGYGSHFIPRKYAVSINAALYIIAALCFAKIVIQK